MPLMYKYFACLCVCVCVFVSLPCHGSGGQLAAYHGEDPASVPGKSIQGTSVQGGTETGVFSGHFSLPLSVPYSFTYVPHTLYVRHYIQTASLNKPLQNCHEKQFYATRECICKIYRGYNLLFYPRFLVYKAQCFIQNLHIPKTMEVF